VSEICSRTRASFHHTLNVLLHSGLLVSINRVLAIHYRGYSIVLLSMLFWLDVSIKIADTFGQCVNFVYWTLLSGSLTFSCCEQVVSHLCVWDGRLRCGSARPYLLDMLIGAPTSLQVMLSYPVVRVSLAYPHSAQWPSAGSQPATFRFAGRGWPLAVTCNLSCQWRTLWDDILLASNWWHCTQSMTTENLLYVYVGSYFGSWHVIVIEVVSVLCVVWFVLKLQM